MSNEKVIRPSDLPPKFLRVKKVMVDGFDGGATRAFEYLDRTDSVGVLVYHKDKELFTWVKQFRIGQATKDSGSGINYTIEPVAGMVDPGQTPDEAAARETFEEVGVQASSLVKIGSFLMCSGISNERMHLYFAEVEGQALNARGGLIEEHEDIDVLHWTAQETHEAFARGELSNAQSMLVWQWACLHKPELTRGIGSPTIADANAPAGAAFNLG